MNSNTASLFKLLLTAVISTSLIACSNEQEIQQVNNSYIQSAPVALIEPHSNYTVAKRYIGKVKTKQLTDLSFEYSGKLSALHVDSGNSVKQGQLLAEQDTELLTIRKKELNAGVLQVQAQIKLNQSNVVRIKRLIDKDYSSRQRLDEVLAEQDILRANLQKLQAMEQSLDYQITHTKLRAPYDAVISKRHSDQGENTVAGTPIFSLIKTGTDEISIGVPADVATDLVIGNIYTATISKKEEQVHLISIGQQVDPVNHTVNIRLDITSNNQHYNGQLAHLHIDQVLQHKGFWVPMSALIDGVRGQWNIYTLAESEGSAYTIKSATVSVLYTLNSQAYITGLPHKNQLIVAEGVHRYVAGQKIKAMDDKASMVNAS